MSEPTASSAGAMAKTALAGVVKPGRHGAAGGAAGVVVTEVRDCGLARMTARRGALTRLIEAVEAAYAVRLSTIPRRVEGRGVNFIWAGPDQWLAQAPLPPGASMEAVIAPQLAKFAAIVDQSHASTLLRISGPRAVDALAKGLAIDLHPRAFAPLHVAVTSVAHAGVHIWQLDATPSYELAVPRSSTLSFWGWLEASAAEYGLEVSPPISLA